MRDDGNGDGDYGAAAEAAALGHRGLKGDFRAAFGRPGTAERKTLAAARS
jgi:hypothetical protein